MVKSNKSDFYLGNVPIKKLSYKKQKGEIEIKLWDNTYNLIYKNKVAVSDKKAIAKMIQEIKLKGVSLFEESTWF